MCARASFFGRLIRRRREPSTDDPNFWVFARDYLHAYMPRARRLSPQTVQAYRISLECFIGYLSDVQGVDRQDVSFDHLERPHLKAWLTWMSEQKGYAPNTVALRLSAVKAFLAYSAAEDITLVALHQGAQALRAPASPRKPIEYLTGEQTRAVLGAFTGQTLKSRRNRMLLILLYETAARVSEITNLQLGDLSLDTPAHLRLTGKRNKTRTVPLTDATTAHLGVYLAEFRTRHLPHRPGEHPLPHAAQDQGDGPLPGRHPAADHHAPAGPRERLDDISVLRVRDPGHDAPGRRCSHPHDQHPTHSHSPRTSSGPTTTCGSPGR